MAVAAAQEQRSRSALRFDWAPALLVAADVVALEICLALGFLARISLLTFFPAPIGPEQYRGLAIGMFFIPMVYWIGGLYPGRGLNPPERLKIRLHSTVMVFSLLITWDYLIQGNQWSRGILLVTAIFALFLPTLIEELTRSALANLGVFSSPVIVLGAGEKGTMVVRHLLSHSTLGLRPVAILDDDPASWGTAREGIAVAGPLSMASSFRARASTVIVALPDLTGRRLSDAVNSTGFREVVIVPDLAGIQTLWVTARDLGGILGLEIRQNLLKPSSLMLKRIFDLALGIPLFLLSLPIVLISAVWIKIASPGPVLFRHRRVGFQGGEFSVIKLRTMRPRAEEVLAEYLAENPRERQEWERSFKLKRDPRIIPGVGHFLRRFSLDELPQFWHVIRGEMSLVGPRPFPEYHLAKFEDPFVEMRASVKPGLTGLWQVNARSDGDLAVQEALDTYYIRNWSPWLDLHILYSTARVVLMGTGAY
jgi:Undecaprenyl-phosphate galactose phosphotransferase WbaP